MMLIKSKPGRHAIAVRIRRAIVALWGPRVVCVLFGHAWRTRAYADGYRCDRCDRTKDGKARAALAAEEGEG
jgi:hypothetical protein